MVAANVVDMMARGAIWFRSILLSDAVMSGLFGFESEVHPGSEVSLPSDGSVDLDSSLVSLPSDVELPSQSDLDASLVSLPSDVELPSQSESDVELPTQSDVELPPESDVGPGSSIDDLLPSEMDSLSAVEDLAHLLMPTF